MKFAVSLFLALGAIVLLVLANSAPLVTIPVVGTVRIAETPFAGNHRLWVAAALLALALAAQFARLRVWPATLAAVAVGILADLAYSGWYWRAEKLDFIAELHATSLLQLFDYRIGCHYLAGGIAFSLAFLLWETFLEARKARTT
jgi:hypothetical protein